MNEMKKNTAVNPTDILANINRNKNALLRAVSSNRALIYCSAQKACVAGWNYQMSQIIKETSYLNVPEKPALESIVDLIEQAYRKQHRSELGLKVMLEECFSMTNWYQTLYSRYENFKEGHARDLTCINRDLLLTLETMLEIALNPMRAVCDTAQKNAKAISPDLLPDALAAVLFSADQMFRLDLLDDVSLSRVDFCTDLKFDRQEQADEYIRLLKKVPCKRVLREVLHWDSTQRRWVPYSESKLVRCGSYEFQIYPKQPQMLTRGLSGAEYAKGVVRIELRAGRKKLKSLHYKYAALLNPCENWCQELMVMAGLSGKIIEGMMIDMLGTGDFYPMKTILQKIDASGFYACTKQQMKRVLDYFPLHSSGEDALKHR